MGLVLDSSVLIASEREDKPVSDLLIGLQEKHGGQDVLLSSITVLEFEHGLHRAKTDAVKEKRRAYLDTVFTAIPIQPFTKEMGQLAGRIEAETRAAGQVIPLPDLVIGETALYLDCTIVTANPRHFRMIPGLRVLDA